MNNTLTAIFSQQKNRFIILPILALLIFSSQIFGAKNLVDSPEVTAFDGLAVIDNFEPNCGNTSASFEITANDDCTNDVEKPVANCVGGVTTITMNSACMVCVPMSSFDLGSYDNCTASEDLRFSFSPNIEDDTLVVTADYAIYSSDTSTYPITLYVTDEAGNSDSCIVQINAIDPNWNCADPIIVYGYIRTEDDIGINNVWANFSNNMGDSSYIYINGGYWQSILPFIGGFAITPEKNDNYLNGVTTYDLVLIGKHILGNQLLDSPYKIIAADANNNKNITALDIVKLRALILHIDDELENNASWRFIDANYDFTTSYPLSENFPETIEVTPPVFPPYSFIGVKIGDVNGTALPDNLLNTDTRTFDGNLVFQLENNRVSKGEEFTIDFKSKDFKNIEGFQFALGFDKNVVEFVDVATNLENLNQGNFGLTKLDEGVILTSWSTANGVNLEEDEILFSLTFKANAEVDLQKIFSINSRYMEAEAYSGSDLYAVSLAFDGKEIDNSFELFQNTPNPFSASTTIEFKMPQTEVVVLKIYDVSGRILKIEKINAVKGMNSVSVKNISTTGVLYYQLETSTETAIKKMMIF